MIYRFSLIFIFSTDKKHSFAWLCYFALKEFCDVKKKKKKQEQLHIDRIERKENYLPMKISLKATPEIV